MGTSRKETIQSLTKALDRVPTEAEIAAARAMRRRLRRLGRRGPFGLTVTKMIKKAGRVLTDAEVDIEVETESKNAPVFCSLYGPWTLNKNWAQMNSSERSSALTLGWHRRDFEDDDNCEYDEDVRKTEVANKVFEESWDRLGKTKQRAAMDLGLDATHFGQVDDGCDGAHGD